MEVASSVQNAPRLKKRAKAIKNRLGELGVDLKLGHAYEAQAIAMGYPDWATMAVQDSRSIPVCSSSDASSPPPDLIRRMVESNLDKLLAFEGPMRIVEVIASLASEIRKNLPSLVSVEVASCLLRQDQYMSKFDTAMKAAAELLIGEAVKDEVVRIAEDRLPTRFSKDTLSGTINVHRFDEVTRVGRNFDTTLGEELKQAVTTDDDAYILIRNHYSFLRHASNRSIAKITDAMQMDMLTMRLLMLVRWCRHEAFLVIVSRMIGHQ